MSNLLVARRTRVTAVVLAGHHDAASAVDRRSYSATHAVDFIQRRVRRDQIDTTSLLPCVFRDHLSSPDQNVALESPADLFGQVAGTKLSWSELGGVASLPAASRGHRLAFSVPSVQVIELDGKTIMSVERLMYWSRPANNN